MPDSEMMSEWMLWCKYKSREIMMKIWKNTNQEVVKMRLIFLELALVVLRDIFPGWSCYWLRWFKAKEYLMMWFFISYC